LVPSIVADLAAGRPVTLTSDGTPVRDYLYVDDAVEAYLAVHTYLRVLPYDRVTRRGPSPPQHAFNFAGGEPTSVAAVLELVLEAARWIGLPSPTRVTHRNVRNGEIREQVLDWTLASSLLGWMPRVTLREGLRRTLDAAVGRPEGQGPLQSDQPGGLVGLGLTKENTPGGTGGGQ
jgi:CDP-glucose 4,6-dehydratase